MKNRKSECPGKKKYLAGKRILPEPISKDTDIVKLIDNMDAYNGGRLRAACHLWVISKLVEDKRGGLFKMISNFRSPKEKSSCLQSQGTTLFYRWRRVG
jgi:hypothetical protein